MKKLLGVLVTSAAIAAALTLAPTKVHADTAVTNTQPANGCAIELDGTQNGSGQSWSKFQIANNKATVGFKVTGDCQPQFILSSWYSPSESGRPNDQQIRFQRVEKQFSAGHHTMTVNLPEEGCFYQVDFYRYVPNATPSHQMLGFVLNGNRDCTLKNYSATCDSLTPTALNRNSYKFMARGSVSGGSIESYEYSFGDKDAAGNTRRGFSSNGVINHTYAQPGTYTVQVTLHVRPENKPNTRPVTSKTCVTKVTVAQPPVCQTNPKDVSCTPVTTTTTTNTPQTEATALVKTGPASTAAIFAAVTAVGTLAHTMFMRRRANR